MKNIKLTDKQKEVILKLRDGHRLYENRITPGARWSLTKEAGRYRWGSVHGGIIDKIVPLLNGNRLNTGVFEYTLTEEGKTIEL